MITVFNRKELIVTMDMKRQSEIRRILADNGIEYTVKTTDTQMVPFFGKQRKYTGSFGMDPDKFYEYKIYVDEKDFEKASFLIKQY